jgi:hypothetical protein
MVMPPWFDEKDLLPGQNWRTEIQRAITNSRVLIACLSWDSIGKEGYVQTELRTALSAYADRPPGSIFIIPLKLDDCEIPDLRIPEYGISLRDLHYTTLAHANGFRKLLESIKAAFGAADTRMPQSQEVGNHSTKGSTQQTLRNDMRVMHATIIKESTDPNLGFTINPEPIRVEAWSEPPIKAVFAPFIESNLSLRSYRAIDFENAMELDIENDTVEGINHILFIRNGLEFFKNHSADEIVRIAQMCQSLLQSSKAL